MDSREYIFIYPLKTNADLPGDFPQEILSRSFETGVFVPQDDSNRFRQLPRYPARLLLLENRCLYIVPHPASSQIPVEIKLDELLQLETGCILLRGWMNFTTPAGVQEVIYNTRGSGPLEDFLGIVKRRWFDATPCLRNSVTLTFGDELDIKFRNSSHLELGPGEIVLAQYFQAPFSFEKTFLLRRIDWQPGNLLLLTSKNRLVWITDRLKQRRERYVSISFSAPFALFHKCRIDDADGQRYVEVSFTTGITWRFLIHAASEEGFSFCQVLNAISPVG